MCDVVVDVVVVVAVVGGVFVVVCAVVKMLGKPTSTCWVKNKIKIIMLESARLFPGKAKQK